MILVLDYASGANREGATTINCEYNQAFQNTLEWLFNARYLTIHQRQAQQIQNYTHAITGQATQSEPPMWFIANCYMFPPLL